MNAFRKWLFLYVTMFVLALAPMGATAQEPATASSPAQGSSVTQPASPQIGGETPAEKSSDIKPVPAQNQGDRDLRPRNDQRGGENLRPEDTRWFGKPGMNEEQFNKQEEDRMKRDEERSKKDEERQQKEEARMKKDQERQLVSMKKKFTREAKNIGMMRKKIARFEKTLTKCGASMPTDIISALDAVDALKSKADASQSMDDFYGHMEEMEGHMQVIRESEGQFGMLEGLCNGMIPQAQRMLKEMRKTKPLEKLIAKSGDLAEELNGLLAEYKTEVDKLDAVLGQVKQAASTDAQEAMETLQTDFFGAMDAVFTKRGQIEAVAQSKKGIDMLTKQLEKLKKQRTKLAKKEGADVTTLTSALEKLEEAIGEIKAVRKAKGDPEEMMEPFSEAFSALEEASEALQELGGGQSDYTRQFMKMMGGPPGGPGGPGPNMKMNFGVPSFGGMMGPSRGPGGPDMMGPGPGGDMGGPRDRRGEDREGSDRGDMMDRRGSPPGEEGFRDDRRDMGPPPNGDFRR